MKLASYIVVVCNEGIKFTFCTELHCRFITINRITHTKKPSEKCYADLVKQECRFTNQLWTFSENGFPLSPAIKALIMLGWDLNYINKPLTALTYSGLWNTMKIFWRLGKNNFLMQFNTSVPSRFLNSNPQWKNTFGRFGGLFLIYLNKQSFFPDDLSSNRPFTQTCVHFYVFSH